MAIKFLNNIDVSGEVEGTSLDINGNANISGTLSGNFVVRSTNNANTDGANFAVDTTNKDSAEYAYEVLRSGTTVAGITMVGKITGTELEGTSLDINGNADISGNLTGLDNVTSTNFIIGGNTINDIDVASEASNADDHLMSALAIKNRIEDFGYITSSGSTSGNAATATALATSRSIGGVSFNGTSAINLPGVNTSGNQDTSGTAAIATAITVADESSDTSCSVLFTTSAAGNLNAKSGSNLTFNSSSGLLTATSFNGSLTGNVTGNVSGNAGGTAKGLSHLDAENSITGHGVIVGNADGTGVTQVTSNAASSNKFLRSRGSANAAAAPSFETIDYASVSGTPTIGSLGALSSISNSNWSGTDLSVTNGGTGRSTLTSGNVLLGNGTSGINTRAIGISDNNIVEIDGSDIASGEFARFTANGLESRTAGEMRVSLNVEDGATADQTQSDINGLAITQVGTIGTGVWQGTAISQTYLSGQSGTNTGDVCSSDHASAGYLTSSSTASKVTVTDSTASTDFPIVFHDESNALLDDTATLTYNPGGQILRVPKDIAHDGDADTYIRFTDNNIQVLMGDVDYTAYWNAAYTAVTSGILSSFGNDFVNHDSGLVVATDDFSANLGTYSGNTSVAYDRTTLTYHGDFLKIKNDHGGADKEVMTLDINGRIGLKQIGPLFGVHDSRSSGADADYYLVNGSMGLGTTPRAADSYIDVVGDVFTGVSDRRFKTDIRPYKNPIEKVKSLNGFTYKYNDLAKSIAPKTYGHDNDMAGVFAQEVQKVVPEAVLIAPCDSDEHGKSISGENYLTVNYEKLVPLLIEAIKEQQEQIEELKEKIDGNPS